MPLYEVRVKKQVAYTARVWADDPDQAVDKAADEAVLPYMGENWDEDSEAECDEPVKIAEDGEEGEATAE